MGRLARDWQIVSRYVNMRSFKKARAFVRSLGLKSAAEWSDYCKSGKKPDDIPTNPSDTYAKRGWAGMGDWLGTGTIATTYAQYRSFKKARAFVRGLGLKSKAEWATYCKSGKKPADIPANPDKIYAEDWLGWYGRLARYWQTRRGADWRPFKKARAFVRGLGLKSGGEWVEYCKSGKKPDDIPANPLKLLCTEMAGPEWAIGWGLDRIADQLRQYRSFKKARAFVRGLGLKSESRMARIL